MSERVSVPAPAKINLVLRVHGRRTDDYHEIDTIFQALDLCDEVRIELGGDGVALEVDGPDLGPPEENLAHAAAERLSGAHPVGTGVRIHLTKRIPVGAGLGGGSSDAAAVLRGLAELLGLSDRALLHRIGAELGSDVPFFLGESPLARGRGRGERLEPMRPLPTAHIVVVSPPVHVSTGGAYAALAEVRAGRAPEPAPGPGDVVLPGSWDEMAALAHNDFEPVISAAHPEIGRALAALRAAGATMALMSGSGSSCFGLFADEAAAARAARELAAGLGWECSAARSLDAFPQPRRG